ncbi:MAG: RagB/SusD family nutrient uptake outer membrane protein [Pedobacter sp.]|uniref:RagB/SusD family nutrient uptake outer membrane protein n=1 Tax=Pedobacter sp. TaxID=1411316 RepID=UPI002806F903|nr:RagB/SusD family nutrient uptake outer membrane protein [Pedobacter sp.]MDQ8004133.1 RagB/SusD family nutrient uptake outer membrane protein [Pedobacter sp.]
MKKINYILPLIVLGVSISSCKKTLEAPAKSSLEASVIFSTQNLAEGAITGILQSFAEQNSHRGRYIVFYGTNTDVEVQSSIKNTADEKSKLANYGTNVNNEQMNTENNSWAMLYSGIERANLAISGLRTYGNVDNNPVMAQLLGEALTLRAVIYLDLIKAWGDVPARFEPITGETLYKPRADRDVIYKQLLADLAEASNYLAWPNGSTRTSSVERINKAFAKGMRARIALMAGGYALRQDKTVRLSNDPDLTREKMYEIAKTECLDVIASGTVRLLPSFETVFRNLNQEVLTAGQESIWELPFADGRGRVIFDLGVNHAKIDKYTAQNRGGTTVANPTMWYEFERQDTRRAVSITPYGWDSDGTANTAFQVASTLGRMYFGKYRYEWMKRRVTSTNDDGINWMYMRYSDILLMAAEAINEIDGPAQASQYLRLVRERAYAGNTAMVATYMATATASKDAFFNAIVKERALEFVGEMLRKQDLIRWNLLDSKLAENKVKLEQLENRQGIYANLPLRVYYSLAADNETLNIYGLNFGDTDAIGAAGGYTGNKAWTMVSTNDVSTFWNALYVGQPSKQPYWPIWQRFLDASNGTLNNTFLGL